MTAILEMRGIGKSFPGVRALDQVNLSVAPGEIHAICGENGAGKSTLMKVLSGVYPHGSYDGEIRYEGHPVAFRDIRDSEREGIIIIHQELALVPQLSVLRNALMGRLDDHGALRNLATFVHPRRAERDAVAAILTEVGLAPEIDRPVGRLSGGQRQRTALARALYRGGDVLVADEPLSAVDPRQAGALADLLRHRFPTAIVALHDVGLARRWATRLVGLRQGRILFDRPVEAVDDARVQALYAP